MKLICTKEIQFGTSIKLPEAMLKEVMEAIDCEMMMARSRIQVHLTGQFNTHFYVREKTDDGISG